MENSNNKDTNITCVQCERKFSTKSNLKKHVKKLHPTKEDYLASLQLRENKDYKFTCNKCNKHFMHARNLRFHEKTHGASSVPNANSKSLHQCAICKNFSADKKNVIDHYIQFHGISVEEKVMVFESNQAVISWKENFEIETNSKYVVENCKSRKTHIYKKFVCHRSGRYIPEGKGLRRLKTKGSNKIGGLCPAGIKVKIADNGKCEVLITETHVGHETDLEHLNLTKVERDNLAIKIASKVPFNDILDEIRDSICDSELKRLHLLSKKDLFNIKSCFNLCSSSVRRSYKSKGRVAEECTYLNKTGTRNATETLSVDSSDSNEDMLIIAKKPHVDDTRALLKDLSSNSISNSHFEKEKQVIINKLHKLAQSVQLMTSKAELNVVKIHIAPIDNKLAALKSSGRTH